MRFIFQQGQGGAALELGTTSIDFGPCKIGQTYQETIVLRNTDPTRSLPVGFQCTDWSGLELKDVLVAPGL
jgi:hypothetical protein